MAKKQSPKGIVEVSEKSLEALADNIAALSEMGKMIQNSRLSDRAILLLLRDMTNMTMGDIQKVLQALPQLEAKYLKKKVKT